MDGPIRVLYVEDNPHDRALVKHALERESGEFEVVEAASRDQFDALVSKRNYDLVLSDFNILGFLGLQVIEAVRSVDPLIPVVIVTGTGSEQVAAEAIKKGATDYVIKTADHIRRLPHTLMAAIEKMRLREQCQRRESQLKNLNATLNAIRSINQLIIKEKNPEVLLRNACDTFVELGAAAGVWIAVLDDSGGLVSLIESGFGELHPAFAGLFGEGSLPECARSALEREEPVVIQDRASECGDCPSATGAGDVGTIVVRMEKDGRALGLMGIYGPAIFLAEEENRGLVQELARDIAFALDAIRIEDRHARAVKEIEESERKLRAITDSAQDAVIMMDEDGRVSFWNPAAERIFGIPRTEILGRSLHDLLTPESYRASYEAGMESFRMNGTGPAVGKVLELTAKRSDGSQFPVELSLSSVRLRGAWQAVGLVRDISERKESERAIRNSARRFDAFMNHFPGQAFIKDSESRYIFFNDYYREGVGADSSWIGKTFGEMTGDEETGRRFAAQDKIALNRGYHVMEDQITDLQGKVWILETHRFPIELEAEGRVVAGIALDVTDRRSTEEEKKAIEGQLRRAQKLEAIATLSGGIAHDFNNILSAILGFSELTLQDVADNPVAKRNLESVMTAGRRARDLVQQILTIGRQQEQERQPLQLRYLVTEALKLLRSTLPTSIAIQVDVDRNSGVVNADPTQMHQVIMNLATNAGHAMRENGGVLQVELHDVECVAGPVANAPGRVGSEVTVEDTGNRLPAGSYVRLSVTDTGSGMDSAVLERIFDPYFTTKEQGEGTGLGLSVVHGIIEQHDGLITVASEPGNGTTFHVYLPRVAAAHEAEPAPEETTVPRGHESILLVDDEEPLTRLGRQLLERLGYRVTASNSSKEALDLFEEHPDRFDLVITDMTMPEMTGDDLTRNLLKIRPDLPIVLCTGFSERINKEDTEALGIRAFMEKPMSVQSLSRILRSLLDKD